MASPDDLDTPTMQLDTIRIATLAVLTLITVTVIALGVYLVTYVQDQRHRNECYQAAFDQLTASYLAGRDAGRQDRQAQRELLLAQSSGVDGRTAIQRYLDQLDEADRTRLSAPPPQPRC